MAPCPPSWRSAGRTRFPPGVAGLSARVTTRLGYYAMADVNADDIVEVKVNGSFQGSDDVVNIFHSKITDPVGGTAAETLVWASEWILDMYAEMIFDFAGTYGFASVDVQNLTQDAFLGNPVTLFLGSNPGEALPPQICCLIMGRTSVDEIDGRKYLGVLGEDTQNGGLFNALLLTRAAAFGAKWRTVFAASSAVVGIGQVVTKAPPAAPVGHDITAVRVITHGRTQRRRTLGRGS